MITIDDREIKRFEAELKTFARKSIPFATRHTLNATAWSARTHAKDNLENKFVLRNKWTAGSVKVDTAKTLRIDAQESRTGTPLDYLKFQEEGGTEQSNGKEGVPIATGYAAGQQGQKPRTRLPRRPNKLSQIRLNARTRGKTRGQRNLIAVRTAAQARNKYVFLDLGRRKGIFKVTGGKRKPRVKMVWDLSRKSVSVQPRPWLEPAAGTARTEMPGIYRDALLFQIKRRGLFEG